MSGKLKVKVIKKGEKVKAAKPARPERVAKREAARQMVSNVTNWVTEFQSRKRDEAKIGFEQLFGQHTRTNES